MTPTNTEVLDVAGLKPCPFCGSPAECGMEDAGAPYPGGHFYVMCANGLCGVEVYVSRKALSRERDAAIRQISELWNSRIGS